MLALGHFRIAGCSLTDSRFSVVENGEGKQLILHMPLPYRPVPQAVWNTDLFAILIVPIYWLVTAIHRAIKKPVPPPRALFEITPDRFHMELVDPETGERTTLECDPAKIVELRKNQYSPGMWIHVTGQTMETHLGDIDTQTIELMCEELREMIRSDMEQKQ